MQYGSIACILIFLNLCSACRNENLLPKPRTYPYIDFPSGPPRHVRLQGCPFTFEFPQYGILERDSTFFDQIIQSKCWFNIHIPQLMGTIHFSYYPISNKSMLEKNIKDAFKLAREHQIKANYVDEMPISKPGKVYGMLFNIEGPVASSFQFYLTDSSHHYLRASLYFNAPTRPDSLGPIIEFSKKDVIQLINTFEWLR